MKSFLALYSEQIGQNVQSQIKSCNISDLDAGDVIVEVHYSGINYKDALAVTGRGKIFKKWPNIAGIDFSGVVLESSDPKWKVGDQVIANGCGIGENITGGYSQIVRISSQFLMPLPKSLSLLQAMQIGTAGFTAALAIERMEQMGQTPSMGKILVTGASGGVGSMACHMLSLKSYQVCALSSKSSAKDYLQNLGAAEVYDWSSLQLGKRPLESIQFGGAIDNLGGEYLAAALAHTQLWGNVASIGLASTANLQTTVMPFILRGVSLLGISSTNTPLPLREKVWQTFNTTYKNFAWQHFHFQEIALAQVLESAQKLLDNKMQGRFIVNLKKN